jgi:hypothetical protein
MKTDNDKDGKPVAVIVRYSDFLCPLRSLNTSSTLNVHPRTMMIIPKCFAMIRPSQLAGDKINQKGILWISAGKIARCNHAMINIGLVDGAFLL